ncbi:MAG TPA: peptide-methionine (S)-S-oxide reductase MsrA [Candidatus Tumulicola sp.]|jgi:peptide-methionine (S)-S-oxide reductase
MKPIVIAALALFLGVAPAVAQTPPNAKATTATTQRVVLAGGCFWGMQLVFESLKGVTSATAGYAGGNAMTAHYDIVSTGMTGHAESVEVTYDPSVISFSKLLDVYFTVAHDPTELNRQGPDDGTQYRSEIYYTTPQQRQEALNYIARLTHERKFSDPIVTKVESFRGFYAAEGYHQNYALHNMQDPYIAQNDLPKLHALRQDFPALVKAGTPSP